MDTNTITSVSGNIAEFDNHETTEMEMEFYSLSNVKDEIPDELENPLEEGEANAAELGETQLVTNDIANAPEDEANVEFPGMRDVLTNFYYEPMPTSDFMCRCSLCNVKMATKSFRKHLTTQMHKHLEGAQSVASTTTGLDIKVETSTMPNNNNNYNKWEKYSDVHPWLVADPVDPDWAYCKYCERRLIYGYSHSKRLNHEQGMNHLKALHEAERRLGRIDGGAEANEDADAKSLKRSIPKRRNTLTARLARQPSPEECDGEIKDDEAADDFEDGNEYSTESDSSYTTTKTSYKKRRINRGTDAWYRIYPYYQRYEKDPNYMYCTYCEVLLSIHIGRNKHEKCSRHRLGAAAGKSLAGDVKQPMKPLMPRKRMQRTPNVSRYAWMAFTKNSQLFVLCKYCRVRIGFHSRKKHDLSQRHRQAEAAYHNRKYNKSEGIETEAPEKVTVSPTSTKEATEPQTVASGAPNTAWHSNYNWLVATDSRTNYARCKVCDVDVFLPTPRYASKHGRSANHIRSRIRLKRKLNPVAEKKNVSSGDFEWYSPIETSHTHGMCRYCKLAVLYSCRHIHQQTGRHQQAKQLHQQSAVKHIQAGPAEPTAEQPSQSQSYSDSKAPTNAEKLPTNRFTNEQPETPPLKRYKESYESAVETANRLTDVHKQMLDITRQLHSDVGDKARVSPSGKAVSSKLMLQPHSSTVVTQSTPRDNTAVISINTSIRNPLWLFIESITETVKALPPDLIAEWKSSVMKLVSDLELRALRRQSGGGELLSPTSSVVCSRSPSIAPDAAPQNHDHEQSCSPLSQYTNNSTHSNSDTPHASNSGAANDSPSVNASIPKLIKINTKLASELQPSGNTNSSKVIKLSSSSAAELQQIARKIPVRTAMPPPHMQIQRVHYAQPTSGNVAVSSPTAANGDGRLLFSPLVSFGQPTRPIVPAVRPQINGIAASSSSASPLAGGGKKNIVRQIQINSQKSPAVIPFQSLIRPQRRFSLSVASPALGASILPPVDPTTPTRPNLLWAKPPGAETRQN